MQFGDYWSLCFTENDDILVIFFEGDPLNANGERISDAYSILYVFLIDYFIRYSLFVIVIMKSNKFDFKYPPDFEKAGRHRMASRIFKGVDESTVEECECCGRKIGADEVQTQCSIEPTQLSFLGPGVPLFFHFMRSVIIMLLLMVLIFSAFAVYSNLVSSDCETKYDCLSDSFNTLSIINKESNSTYLSIQSYLAVGYVLVAILYLHYLRYRARQMEQECDEIVNSPSDYAIILRKLPKDTSEADIVELIERRRRELGEQQLKATDNLKVQKVVLSYKLREYIKVRDQNKQQFMKCIKEDRMKQFVPKQLPTPTETSQIAIVVFSHQETKDHFIHKPRLIQRMLQFFCTPCLPLSDLTIKGQQIGIERAPEPDEITWQNSGITVCGSIGRKVGFGLVAFCILGLGGAAQYGLSLMQINTEDDTMRLIVHYANPLLVTLFNIIIELTLIVTTEKERNETVTEFQAMLVVKITILQFFNAGIFVIAANIAVSYETFQLANGIVGQVTLIIILDALVPNATHFFLKYFQIVGKLKLSLVRRGCWLVSQSELNKMSIGPEVNLPQKYAQIMKTLLLTALFASMVPIVVGIALLGLILGYFIEKLMFTRAYSMPANISSMTFWGSIELVQYFLMSFAMGQFIIYGYFYSYQIGNIPFEWMIIIFACLALAVLNSALPMQAINEKLFSVEQSSKSSLTYSQVEGSFEVTYEMLNPAYKVNRARGKSKDYVSSKIKWKDGKEGNVGEMMDYMTAEQKKLMNKEPLLGQVAANKGGEIEMVGMNGGKPSVGAQLSNNKGLLEGDQKASTKKHDKKKQSNRFRYFEVKQVKNKEQNSYRALVEKTMGVVEVKPEEDHNLQSVLLAVMNQTDKNPKADKEKHQMIEENYKTNFGKGSTVSKGSLIHEERRVISSQQLAFPQVSRQVKGTYDPIKVGSSYKKFFNDSEKMLSKSGSYMNKKLVMKCLGTPFSHLVRMIDRQQNGDNPNFPKKNSLTQK